MSRGPDIGKWMLIGGVLGVVVLGGAVVVVHLADPHLPGDQTNSTESVPSNGTADGTLASSATATTTATADGLTTVRSPYAAEVERLLRTAINEYRDRPLAHRRSIATELDSLAKAHSKRMAVTYRVGHTIYGETTLMRFKQAGIASRCEIDQAGGDAVYTGEDLELVAHLDRSGMNQADIARALLATWANSDEGWKLRITNAEYLGVGIVIVGDSVYATVIVC